MVQLSLAGAGPGGAGSLSPCFLLLPTDCATAACLCCGQQEVMHTPAYSKSGCTDTPFPTADLPQTLHLTLSYRAPWASTKLFYLLLCPLERGHGGRGRGRGRLAHVPIIRAQSHARRIQGRGWGPLALMLRQTSLVRVQGCTRWRFLRPSAASVSAPVTPATEVVVCNNTIAAMGSQQAEFGTRGLARTLSQTRPVATGSTGMHQPTGTGVALGPHLHTRAHTLQTCRHVNRRRHQVVHDDWGYRMTSASFLRVCGGGRAQEQWAARRAVVARTRQHHRAIVYLHPGKPSAVWLRTHPPVTAAVGRAVCLIHMGLAAGSNSRRHTGIHGPDVAFEC